MLLSMTGFGEASCQTEELAVNVQIRAVNHRYLKVITRLPEGYASLEPAVENTVRKFLRRGTVTVYCRIARTKPTSTYTINEEVLVAYFRQLESIRAKWGLEPPETIDGLLHLPGITSENPLEELAVEEDWPVIEQTLCLALDKLNEMRRREGQAMEADLRTNCDKLDQTIDQVAERAPSVVEAYKARLQDRLNELVAQYGGTVSEADIARELCLFADRCDISEEIVRLRSHVEQFRKLLQESDSQGRRLDFLVQEMFREANTIGAKANDSQIAHLVVEMKTAIERMREVLQNVE